MRNDAPGEDSGEVKCAICGAKAKAAFARVGAFCSELCKRELMERDEKRKAELLAEPVDQVPDEFDVPAFERYVLKVALHMIKTLPPATKAKWLKKSPMLLVSDELAMEIKGKVLLSIPQDYAEVTYEREGKKILMDPTYLFKKKVPKDVILGAMVKSKVFKRPPESGDA